MSYRPRQLSTTANLSGRKVDGVATRIVAASFSTMNTGNSFANTSLNASITAAVHSRGGCLRSDGTFLPVNHRGDDDAANFHWNAVLDFASTPLRVRSGVGSAFTGAGNVLSDGVVVIEFIP